MRIELRSLTSESSSLPLDYPVSVGVGVYDLVVYLG